VAYLLGYPVYDSEMITAYKLASVRDKSFSSDVTFI